MLYSIYLNLTELSKKDVREKYGKRFTAKTGLTLTEGAQQIIDYASKFEYRNYGSNQNRIYLEGFRFKPRWYKIFGHIDSRHMNPIMAEAVAREVRPILNDEAFSSYWTYCNHAYGQFCIQSEHKIDISKGRIR